MKQTRAYPPQDSAWSVVHRPGANAQATITRAAPGTGRRLVCLGFTVTFVAGATAPAAVVREVSLIDGGTGGSTLLSGSTLSLPAVAGAMNGWKEEGAFFGTENTQMTLEFASAGGANTTQSVTMHGYVE